ncbi:hypothetical protein HL667_29690 [Bradyrhizobium sp. 83012]|uniref:Uncharacterized protein n=1 Tax=Bradyrhizobium aeschynomenes TaxID=2734909 RepID=A0ABX2CLY2_9BRAD|nr:hypothetical protein [Bradyrhizobium aeschynomenes]NPU09274.1 hypothetical protein [Bradyrhizobium aeschynomenes]NPU69211.1 hypothetical protein [Bradyrhizobium aeschynomenes]NPV20594.1 hypothetical protein [Bradyrhizobium aeschynomenes]
MSLYERIDRDVAPRSRERIDYLLVYAVCFIVLMVEGVLRRIGSIITGHRPAPLGAILGEARIKAANCATSSFMGL